MPDELVLHPSGDIDLAVAEGLRAEWYAALDEAQPARVIVDLSDVPFMDAQGLSLFAGLANRQRARHGSMAVRHPSPLIVRLMTLTGLTSAIAVIAPDGKRESGPSR